MHINRNVCHCNGTYCKDTEICQLSEATCFKTCPEKYFKENSNVVDYPSETCFCSAFNYLCKPDEVCGSDGCLGQR